MRLNQRVFLSSVRPNAFSSGQWEKSCRPSSVKVIGSVTVLRQDGAVNWMRMASAITVKGSCLRRERCECICGKFWWGLATELAPGVTTTNGYSMEPRV